jgi:hypothetical protein
VNEKANRREENCALSASLRKSMPYLQGMLQNSPMKAKGIRLVEDPNGGVTVWVGIQRYPGIDAVTDPEALAIIRAAVAEWERHSTD